jgi:hypothetical protein
MDRRMDNQTNQSSPVARLIPVVIFFTGLLGIYYLYQYLFGPSTANRYDLLTGNKPADVELSKPIIVTSEKLPMLYEGGEFTVSTWIYVSNWNYRAGRNKAVFRLGGPNFDTIRIYLGGRRPKIHVRIQTKEINSSVNSVPTNANEVPDESLTVATLKNTFESLQTDSGLLDSSPMCDLPECDLQRWVNITVAVNGRTADVYMDGKLARSCVLPSFYKVDAGGYSAYLLSYGGFGGFIATTSMYDAALNPEVVYKNYIAGPEPIQSLGDWFRSIFKFGVNVSVDSK